MGCSRSAAASSPSVPRYLPSAIVVGGARDASTSVPSTPMRQGPFHEGCSPIAERVARRLASELEEDAEVRRGVRSMRYAALPAPGMRRQRRRGGHSGRPAGNRGGARQGSAAAASTRHAAFPFQECCCIIAERVSRRLAGVLEESAYARAKQRNHEVTQRGPSREALASTLTHKPVFLQRVA